MRNVYFDLKLKFLLGLELKFLLVLELKILFCSENHHAIVFRNLKIKNC